MKSALLGPPEPVAAKAAEEHWFNHEDDTRMLGFGKGRAGYLQAIESLGDGIRGKFPGTRVLGVYHGGDPAGFLWITSKHASSKTAELHAYIKPESRGKWAFHGAFTEVLGKLFGNGIYRVTLEPLKINRKFITLLRTKYGFKQEGIHRSSLWMDGNPYDTVTLRLLKREWNK